MIAFAQALCLSWVTPVVCAIVASGLIYWRIHGKHIETDGEQTQLTDNINFVSAPKTFNSFRKGHN